MSSERGDRGELPAARPVARQSAARGRGGMPRGPAQPKEHSAGGAVVRGGELLVIVPRRRAADGSRVLGLPKGHIDPDETPLQAAVREVREETGVDAQPLAELGEVRYWYQRAGRVIPKSVVFFLLRHIGGDTADHDDEVEEVRWLPLARACAELTYRGEREIAARARAALEPLDGGAAGR
jgi:8-oxo-dGTP pyrophosphatase MutT (NUDIX family)